jgi:hypothetical protein
VARGLLEVGMSETSRLRTLRRDLPMDNRGTKTRIAQRRRARRETQSESDFRLNSFRAEIDWRAEAKLCVRGHSGSLIAEGDVGIDFGGASRRNQSGREGKEDDSG